MTPSQALPSLGWHMLMYSSHYCSNCKTLGWLFTSLDLFRVSINTSIRALTICILPAAINYDIFLAKLLASQTDSLFCTCLFHVTWTRMWVLWKPALFKAYHLFSTLSSIEYAVVSLIINQQTSFFKAISIRILLRNGCITLLL